MKCVLALSLVVASPTLLASDVNCDRLAKAAESNGAMLSPPVSYEVGGDGRLYFFSAPDESCRMPGTFVIPKDSLAAYTEYKGWYSVMYLTKKGDPVQGWVRADRLKFAGTLGPDGR